MSEEKQQSKAIWLKPYQFQPGKTGNPKGGPKSRLSKLLSEYAEIVDPKEQKTYGQLLVEKMFHDAIYNSDPFARREIWQRLEGAIKPAKESDKENPGNAVVMAIIQAMENAKNAGIITPQIESNPEDLPS